MDIEKLISEMTTEEKLCQMTQTNRVCVFRDQKEGIWDFQALHMTDKQYDSIGSALSYTMEYDVKGNLDEHLKNDRNKIPLMIMLDVIHGYKTIFPIPLAMGASFDTELVEECSKFAAVEATKEGVMATFSPMVDLARDARWGRIMETTSEDPYVNGEFGKAMIRGYHAGGLACCVKHFAAYGAAESGRDYNLVDMSEHTLREYYLRGYQECLKENPEMVMASFNSLNGIPATGNTWLMRDILRNEWGFDGVVISDYNGVCEMIAHRFKENRKEAARAGILAGVDIEMCSSAYSENGESLVEKGEIDIELINDSVRRILKLKEKYGLFENPYYQLSDEKSSVSEDGRTLARKMAEETFVLLKNEKGVLPLKKQENIVLIGPFADTKEILGGWSPFGDKTATITIKQGVETLLGESVESVKGCGWAWNDWDRSGFEEALIATEKADKIVLCVGEHQSESSECKSKTDIRISKTQRKLIKEIKKTGKPIIGVIFAGRPLVLKDVVDCFDAILYVWQPGTEGGNAIANVLYGKTNPSGKLSVSLPRTVGQCPIYYNRFSTGRPQAVDAGFFVGTTCYIDEKSTALFPFGFGLSYTRFEYSKLQLSSSEMHEDERVCLRTKIKNVGDFDGVEVAQLYIRDDYSEIVRPVKELKGFQRISLKAGEEKEIEFEITVEMLKYYGVNNVFAAEKGTFTLMVGSDSEHLQEISLRLV